ncbi:hypothetical protein METBIDRAFT_29946 [Metschnikowia bicuspidata var. bicuspidata NRRL YB-4993]|uniref:Uncharacterized protein n=1 Tax=Metschnikowia bicuspidata var. bicuspidata NRRL YB-4993 TaxID=869754 RepID=A0A1A0HI23_9ASCO|nr:hypothetical protein METBIDRAFT_29946 [Metschnikowia bicuspidata var. bicuspidata NRRL YB-4993]OBA23493.1 hypothetical protein METBIDRAFT_29946 [Metschnikowia bicuspidata var. bicuspidata NRRL YB-4993]
MADAPKERRHAFRSFKERVDAMKIEPSRKLNARAHDYVETSHFLATLEHWKEVNISGDFTDFLREVEPLCQTLPQILHHQTRIFEALHAHIQKNDVNLIQPLLELMAQFVHDLGSDFMPFYRPFLQLVVDLAQQTSPNDAQNMRNTSNVLEWCFNTLAFAFKYLARVLTEDLTPTLAQLLPVLQMTKKTYVLRFCAEAVSFLVKKLKPEPLMEAVRFLFNTNRDLLDQNSFYRESLVTLFSEAMKNTQDTFHLRAGGVFSALLENALADTSRSDTCVGTLCDIMLQALKHGSARACERFHASCMAYLEDVVAQTRSQVTLQYVAQVLITVCFAESGKKILDWPAVFVVVEALVHKARLVARSVDQIAPALMALFAHLFATIVRNCPLEHLSKHFESMSAFLASSTHVQYYLSFYELAVTSAPDKMATFGAARTLQTILNKTSSDAQLISFAQKLQRLEAVAPQAIGDIVLPSFLSVQLLDMMEQDIQKPFCSAVLQGLFWKLKLLSFLPEGGSELATPLRILQSLSDRSLPQTPFLHDVLGTSMSVTVRLSKAGSLAAAEMYTFVQNCLEPCRASLDFLSGATRLLEKHQAALQPLLAADMQPLCAMLAHNFSLPDRQVRTATASFLAKLHRCAGAAVPFAVSQVLVIDAVPLTVANANDIKMRIRHAVSQFALVKDRTPGDRLVLSQYVVGLLSNNFQPCWLAVYECLPQLAECGCLEPLWNALFAFVKYDYSSQPQAYLGAEDGSLGGKAEPGSRDVSVPGATDEGLPDVAGPDASDEGLPDVSIPDVSVPDEDSPNASVPNASVPNVSVPNASVPVFQVLDERLSASIAAAQASVFASSALALLLLLAIARAKNSARSYNPQLRARVIKALQAVAYVVEQHGAEFVQYVVRLQSADPAAQAAFASWSGKDKLALVGVCGKFKRLARVPGNDALFALVLENLSSKQTAVQQESLEALFAWNNAHINKYRDNLKNLLEDKLFRDELQQLVSKHADARLAAADADAVLPVVLRILYGRAKGASNNKSKNGRKFAVATVLPNLPDAAVAQFLDILAQHLEHGPFFLSRELAVPSRAALAGMVGYVNMLLEVYSGLGYKFAHVVPRTVRPLVFALVSAQKTLDAPHAPDELTLKVARTVRLVGFRCLDHLFKITAASFEWSADAELIFSQLVAPRLARFAQENAQQPSALMALVVGWIGLPRLVPFLYLDGHAAVRALMLLLASPHAKDPVQLALLDFCIAAFTRKDIADDRYYTLLALVVDGLLAVLPRIIEAALDRDISARAATLLLLIIDGGYVQEHATRRALVAACASAIRKPPAQLAAADRVSLLLLLVTIVDGLDGPFDGVAVLYDVCALALRSYKDRQVREALVQIFAVLGRHHADLAPVAALVADLNAYSPQRMAEPDFDRRLRAFRTINDDLSTQLSPRQWLPIVQACLFFINDPDEVAIRLNASHTLTRFVAALASKAGDGLAAHRDLFHAVVEPHLRTGLRKERDDIKDGYVHVLAAAVRRHDQLPELASMRVLLADDPDDDFFANFTHIQLKCRQQAIRSLAAVADRLSPECVHHYILPMTESYTKCDDDKMRPILDETHATWAHVVRRLRWDHFRLLFRRHIAAAALPDEAGRRDRIRLVVHLSQGMLAAVRALRSGAAADGFAAFPDDAARADNAVMREFFEPIMKIVRVRDDDTVVDRTLLVEAAVNCLLCVADGVAEAAISGTLTSTCQALRLRYQPTRDAVRKTLCRATRIVGAKYLKFVVQELKSALSRGAQIHVLSYTLHAVLAAVRDDLEPGDLDESAPLIVDIIMEDVFGAAGQDKDAEDYVSSMKEVKAKKSFETGELLCANISLPCFRFLVEPLKMLLKVNLPLRTRRKLDDLLRKYAHGLLFNPSAATRDVLVLCFELHQQSTSVEFATRKYAEPTEAEEHFLVRTHARPTHSNVDRSQVVFTLQKLCFELMRSALGKHAHLMTVANLDAFVPLMEASLEADDEGLLVALFRVLDLVAKLDFPDARDAFFAATATRAFAVLQDLATTASELSQTCLRYLATLVRHRSSVTLGDSAMVYVLVRIMPDLEDPDHQGLAFNFLKAVLFQHILLPEVYEVMDKVSRIMVVNHNKEIRDMSRVLYFQFLMEYEQGPAKLDKAFRFLVSNLAYPTQLGRESVMELMHSIVLKASDTLLAQLATSFFVGLANVAVADDILKCREMASSLIARLLKKVGQDKAHDMENFIHAWMTQKANALLTRCGLVVYKVYVSVFGYGASGRLDQVALLLIDGVTRLARNGAPESDNDWEDVYTAMSVFSGVCASLGSGVLTARFESIWRHVLDTILYPHTWVRLLAARLVGVLLGNLDKLEFSLSGEQLQTIAYRLLRQLGAPVVAPELGSQVVKDLIQIVTKWQQENTPFYVIDKTKDDEENAEAEPAAEVDEPPRYALAVDFILARVCALMRQDTRSDRNLVARKSAIQLGAVIAHLVPTEKLAQVARQLLFGMYYILEQDAYSDAENDVLIMARESTKALEEKLGVNAYLEIHTGVRQHIDRIRQERRVKRSQLAVNAPDVAARRKLKRHGNFREKRKNRKDENGYYRAKRTKRNQA